MTTKQSKVRRESQQEYFGIKIEKRDSDMFQQILEKLTLKESNYLLKLVLDLVDSVTPKDDRE